MTAILLVCTSQLQIRITGCYVFASNLCLLVYHVDTRVLTLPKVVSFVMVNVLLITSDHADGIANIGDWSLNCMLCICFYCVFASKRCVDICTNFS